MSKIIKLKKSISDEKASSLPTHDVIKKIFHGLEEIDQLIDQHSTLSSKNMSVKILIVEDEPLISEDLSSILSQQGYQVIGQAYDGVEALDMIHSRNPDIVLLDISLDHQMSGIDVARHLNDNYQIPFIFITSHTGTEILDAAKKLLPEGYIVKPFKQKDILATLEIVVHRFNCRRTQTPYKTLEAINQQWNSHLTTKEYEIMKDVAMGLSNEALAEKHFISLNTVKTHLKNIFFKVDIESRSQVAAIVFKN